jgi:hypothetical protein
MKNKKGFLLGEETLKIVIAVICLIFLVFLLAKLYYNYNKDEDLELAKASLEHLIDEINAGSESVEIYNPSSSPYFPGGWILISFPFEDSGWPKSCSNSGWKNCLCICNEAPNTIKDSGFAVDCDNKGICLENDFIIQNKKIKIENPPLTLNIDYENKKITK